jgi:hypothetical protein
VNIFRENKLLLNIHSKLCNPSIPHHRKIHTKNGDYERKEMIKTFEKLKGSFFNALIFSMALKWFSYMWMFLA